MIEYWIGYWRARAESLEALKLVIEATTPFNADAYDAVALELTWARAQLAKFQRELVNA